MRPLIVDLGREYRGGQHQALLLARGLRERGHAPTLIAIRGSLLAARAKESGVPVEEVDSHSSRISAAARIRRLVRGGNVDVVHANEPHALTAAWLARAHRAVPVVVSRRIALPLSRGALSLSRYRAASRIVAVSHFVAQSVIRSGLSADRVAVVYDGVAVPAERSAEWQQAARRELGIAPDEFCIGNAAAFVPEKGHALLLDAFAEVRDRFPQSRLLVRGAGPELPKFQSSAGRLRLSTAVRVLPGDFNIEKMFAAIDLFAFPSHEEPLGSALLAAMAHGLPCVAIARGGVPEVIEDGKNGALVETLDAKRFASAIARLLEHPSDARRLGESGRETVKDKFSADQMVERTVRLYEEALSLQSR